MKRNLKEYIDILNGIFGEENQVGMTNEKLSANAIRIFLEHKLSDFPSILNNSLRV